MNTQNVYKILFSVIFDKKTSRIIRQQISWCLSVISWALENFQLFSRRRLSFSCAFADDGAECMFASQSAISCAVIGSGNSMRGTKRVRIKKAKKWWHRAPVKVGHFKLSCDCIEASKTRKTICVKRSFREVRRVKSVNTKLTTAIGLWGNGNQRKTTPSPTPSPPASPSSPSSPDKSPSLKSRFFNNYMNQKKESKGEKVELKTF